MKRAQSFAQAVGPIGDGASVMVAGFMCCGNACGLIDAIIAKGVRGLTLITNDCGFPERGVGKLIVGGQVSHLITSHMGTNPVAGQKMNDGSMKVDLVPQGSLAEKIRCGGAGLGGVLTPTGLGTDYEQGKREIEVDGKSYILEAPLTADFALVNAAICDESGNAFVAKSAKNFSVVMAMAAEHTIVEADRVVTVGALDPELVHIPAVFVKTIACEAQP
jgi:acetate CoA/acetoacetate CoA-transferase alpha subunit